MARAVGKLDDPAVAAGASDAPAVAEEASFFCRR